MNSPATDHPIARAAPARHNAKLTKPEQLFAQLLAQRQAAGEVLWWAAHPMTLRLGVGLSYTPDFMAVLASGVIALYEVKGTGGFKGTRFNGGHVGSGNESRAKFLASVEAFPCYEFYTAIQKRKRDGGGFVIEPHAPRSGYGASYSVCVVCDRALLVGQFPAHVCGEDA